MTENGKLRDVGLKLWLILSTIITVIASAYGVFLSIALFSSIGNIYSVVFLIWILANPYLSFLAWKHYRAGNRQSAIIFSIIPIIVSIINIGILFIVVFFLGISNFT